MKKLTGFVAILLFTSVTLTTLFAPPAQAATRPGYNGKILYAAGSWDNENIWSMNSDGTNKSQLTSTAGFDRYPEWSPDGTKIAFVSNRDGNREIYVMDADGSDQTRLTNNAVTDTLPQWSPDGQSIAYISSPDGQAEIYVMDADGSDQTRLTNTTGYNQRMSWSPDGTKIAFESSRTGSYHIYTMNANGTSQTQLTNTAVFNSMPTWTNDGLSIIFTRYNNNSDDDVYIMDADGQNLRALGVTTAQETEYILTVSPDGTSILTDKFDTNFDIDDLVIIGINNPTYTVLPIRSQDIFYPDTALWSPDGTKILLNGYVDSDWSAYGCFVIDSDGSNPTPLTNDGESCLNGLDWQLIPNASPGANNDTASAAFNSSTLIDVLANDTDEEALSGSNLTVSVQPTHGSAVIESGKVRYTPVAGYQGSDSLSYQICDSFALDQKCATGTLNLTVLAPTAPDVAVTNVNGETYSPNTDKYATSNPRPIFSGTATPGAEITVEIHSDPIVLTTIADGNGNWSVTPTFDLPSGQHMVYISATLNGLTTQINSFQLVVNSELASTGMNIWVGVILSFSMLVSGLGVIYKQRKLQ